MENLEETQITLRVRKTLLDRLDSEAERLEREIPGVRWSRAAVIRVACEQYLANLTITAPAD
jgi:hypothetical protein